MESNWYHLKSSFVTSICILQQRSTGHQPVPSRYALRNPSPSFPSYLDRSSNPKLASASSANTIA